MMIGIISPMMSFISTIWTFTSLLDLVDPFYYGYA